MQKLVLSPAVDDRRLTLIREAARPMTVVNCETVADAVREIADAQAFFGKLLPEMLSAARDLKWVQTPTASLEHYLFPELIEHSCQLSNMRGLFSDVIADHVMGYILCAARNLHLYVRRQIEHRWEPVGGERDRCTSAVGPSFVCDFDRTHRDLFDCTLGVVGVGNIGSEICRRAAAFKMHVIGVDPVVREVPRVVQEVWPMSRLDDLLRQSDFVVIAAPHTPQTYKLFRREQFELMKPTAWLVNIGRGVIVDLAELTHALQEKTIAGAALDVFETEPLPADHPLWDMENVILTPHIAAASPHISERHLETLLENIRCFVRGEPPVTLVDKRFWF
jgi:phosphoglycerate dehydrogenase-like enzyme